MENRIIVPLKNFADPELQRESERFEAFKAGGGGMIRKKDIILSNLTVVAREQNLEVVATNNGQDSGELKGFADAPRQTILEGTCKGLTLSQDWLGYDRLDMEVTNGDKPLTIELIVIGARGRITDRQDLAPSQRESFSVDLIDLPLVQGKQPSFEPTGVRIAVLWDGDRNQAAHMFTMHSLVLEPSVSDKIRPCVDRFGQRVNGSWPEKVSNESELIASIDKENRQLQSIEAPAERGRFGGWTAGPRHKSTDFFRVHQNPEGRWWYIDPDGYQFWSVGSTGIRFSDNTMAQGRELLFEELPAKDGPYGDAWDSDGCVRFYYWNILRKWGSLEKWRDHNLIRIKKWGYNTVANWSAEIMMDQQSVPHVRTLNTKGPEGLLCGGSFYDVFDKRWENWFTAECNRGASPHRDNPWVLGYFVDNEKSWNSMRLLEASDECELRNHWIALVRERYTSIGAFNDATGLDCASWEQVRALHDSALPREGVAQELREELENRYTEQYFSKVRRILKAADPNHLYMGCRFVQRVPRDQIVRLAGRYVDVLSVNCYSLYPRREVFQKWHDLAGRPIQIGEHQLALYGVRQLPPIWSAFTEGERRVYYPKYDRSFAEMPFSLGSHWFQYVDQCITGRPSNGENQMIGVVDITDQPHPEMVEAIREIAANAYLWHSESR